MTTKQTTRRRKKRLPINKVNLGVDLAAFTVFLLVLSPESTGMNLHEWLGIALGGTLIVHLALHWKWVKSITKRLFTNAPNKQRLNYLINTAFLAATATVIITGLMMSEQALPAMGLALSGGDAVEGLHEAAANLALPILGLHVALHWKWIVSTTKRMLPAWMKPAAKAKPKATNPAALMGKST